MGDKEGREWEDGEEGKEEGREKKKEGREECCMCE